MKTNKKLSRVLVIALILLSVLNNNSIVTTLAGNELLINTKNDDISIMYEDSPRGEFEKHFVMSDGSVIAATYPETVYYKNGKSWTEVDNTLTLTNGYYKNNDKDFLLSFADNLAQDNTVTVNAMGYTISWHPQIEINNDNQIPFRNDYEILVNDASTFEKNGTYDSFFASKAFSSITYKNVFDTDSTIDLKYDIAHNRIKEFIILNDKIDIVSITMKIDTGLLSLELNKNKTISIIDGDGTALYNISAPYIFDSAGNELFDIDITIEQEGDSYLVSYVPDYEWFNSEERVFPIVFDPTVTTSQYQSNYSDTYVHENDSPGDHYTEANLIVGNISGNKHRSYLKIINLPSIPTNSIIFCVQLMTKLHVYTTTGGNFSIYQVNQAWNESTISYSSQPSSSLIESGVPCNVTNGTKEILFDVTTYIRNCYINSSTSNYGFMIRYSNESLNDYNYFYSSNCGSSSYYPIMTIQYNPGYELESNNSINSANELSISALTGHDSYIFGKLSSTSDVDYFFIKPLRHGRIIISLDCPQGYTYIVEMYSSSGSPLSFDYSNTIVNQFNGAVTNEYSFIATRGASSSTSCPTYYLKVMNDGNSVSSNYYRLKVKYTSYSDLNWSYPLPMIRNDISSPVGYRSFYINGNQTTDYHQGIDIPGDKSDNVSSACSGLIIEIGQNNPSMGNYIVIESNDIDEYTGNHYYIYYMHLDSFSATIIYYLNYLGINLNLTNPATVSIPINSGTVLGKMGDSGNTTGVHLHFQIQTASSLNSNNNSTIVNPVDVFETTVGFVGDIYWPENWY